MAKRIVEQNPNEHIRQENDAYRAIIRKRLAAEAVADAPKIPGYK